MFPYSTDTSNYFQYFLADHLGNTRVAFDTPHDTLKVEQQDDYLPFGMEISQGTVANPKNEYLYNKKELQENTGLYDYGARFYDPVVGRWNTVDPLAETSRRFSPYNYGEDNSIRNIDPDGMETGDSVDQLLTGIGNQFMQESDERAAKQRGQQQSSGDGATGKNKGKGKKGKSKTSTQKWDSDIPVIGLADKAGDELKDGQYANAALDEASAMMEMFTFAESEVVNAGVSAWDSLTGLFIKDAGNIVNKSSTAVLVNGYYEVNGFKFSEYYYKRLWNTGRGAPSLVAKEVLNGAKKGIPDAIKAGFNKYVYGGWEMIYNPATKEVWHLQPIK